MSLWFPVTFLPLVVLRGLRWKNTCRGYHWIFLKILPFTLLIIVLVLLLHNCLLCSVSGQDLTTQCVLLVLHAVLSFGFHHLIQRDVFHFHPTLYVCNTTAWEAFQSLLWELQAKYIREALPLSWGAERTPLCAKLFLREEPGGTWIWS